MPPTSMPNEYDSGPSSSSGGRPPIRPFHRFDDDSGSRSSRSGSWDLLAGVRKFEHSYDRFDSRNANETHLAFAEGDLPKNRFTRFYNYLLNVSIVSRWTLFIIPGLAILWIPGILGLTEFPDATIWGVKLLWWSIWLSIAWGGWWGCLAAAMLLPRLARYTVGIVAVGSRRYIDWLEVLHRYVALSAWSLTIWIVWGPLIDTRVEEGTSSKSVSVIALIYKLLFGLLLCTALLLFEKFSIQWIAGKFHERSYAERIADQKFAVKTLATLYRHSNDIPGRSDTLRATRGTDKRATLNPKKFFKRAIKGVRFAATTTTTALGNVASEIAGSSVLQPNSPQAMVQTALASSNKTRMLARRLFLSFVRPGYDYLVVDNIARFFPTYPDAQVAFAIFDKDGNGDITMEELEMSCLEFHREQLSIEHSMRDLDSAVGRLDNILMSVYVVVAILIFAVTLEAQIATLITGGGSLILGLSWLIGGSLSDVLTSIIFLFIRHPFDVGDRVNLGEHGSFTVKEIRLLSTVFLDGNNTVVQAPNTVLNTLFIQNIRRSPQMSESFKFDVHFSTSFEKIEALRQKMLDFVTVERRDFLPQFDVSIDIPGQEKMTLTADIMYKSNWQQGAITAKRRNKWITALKTALAEVFVYGPKGNPDAAEKPKQYTLVPWETVSQEDKSNAQGGADPSRGLVAPSMPIGGWNLTSNDTVLMAGSGDIFDEAAEFSSETPQGALSSDVRDDMRYRPNQTPRMPAAVEGCVLSRDGIDVERQERPFLNL
ncbi:Mechanosensitive ion channel [Heterobasidion irregulare TC 32-1]|uniref:Mechanosensitive ion channel n=1 Tax=Heterobasidion irregulare (strain TC 32-1) TaxID=747525 RepID=W4K5V9_HETIT|nr:Mechanosensitive ion channel [Heterobasidion irregulare TC 32-1]ETW80431.1 Mechanosensitive ion channel [Heterobasidion irregulare TC 32-1]